MFKSNLPKTYPYTDNFGTRNQSMWAAHTRTLDILCTPFQAFCKKFSVFKENPRKIRKNRSALQKSRTSFWMRGISLLFKSAHLEDGSLGDSHSLVSLLTVREIGNKRAQRNVFLPSIKLSSFVSSYKIPSSVPKYHPILSQILSLLLTFPSFPFLLSLCPFFPFSFLGNLSISTIFLVALLPRYLVYLILGNKLRCW